MLKRISCEDYPADEEMWWHGGQRGILLHIPPFETKKEMSINRTRVAGVCSGRWPRAARTCARHRSWSNVTPPTHTSSSTEARSGYLRKMTASP